MIDRQQPPSSSPEQSPESRSQVAARGWTLLIANVTKLAGIAIAVNEALIRPDVRSAALAVAALMMLGAQVTENVILAAIDRFFSKGS